jgi:hypothetical protein
VFAGDPKLTPLQSSPNGRKQRRQGLKYFSLGGPPLGDDMKKNLMLLGKTLHEFNGRKLCKIRLSIDKSFLKHHYYTFTKI